MTANNHTQLDTVETTAFSNLPTNYREYRARHCEAELLRAESVYSHIDFSAKKSRSEKLKECRTLAWFARHSDTGEVRIISNACKLRWCPICSKAKQYYIQDVVCNWIKSLKHPKFMTLTMKHTDAPLDHQIKWLYKHFRLFRQGRAIAKYFKGGIWFFQLKISDKDTRFHPHLHVILDSEFIPKELLSLEWQKQTKTSKIVDIRAIFNVSKIADYVSRYCARPANLMDYSFEKAIEIVTVFHGKRLCGTWGSAKRLSLTGMKTTDRYKWVKVGRWKDVLAQSKFSDKAKYIIHCWQTGEPAVSDLKIGDYHQDDNPWIGRAPPNLGIEDINFNWESFK